MQAWPVPEFDSGAVITVTVHEVVKPYEPRSRDEWKACRERWRQSGKTDCSVWGKYSELVASGHYHYANYDHSEAVGWPEGLVALSLMDDGFSCWTGVQLFRNRQVDKQKRANTEAVENRFKSLGLKQPRTVQKYLSETKTGKTLLPKNPDLVAYHESRHSWLFCEVKRDEPIDRKQTIGLAVLHLLTGASVAIVRLVPEARTESPRSHKAQFYYRGPTWCGSGVLAGFDGGPKTRKSNSGA